MAFKVTHVETPQTNRVRTNAVETMEVPADVVTAMEAEWKFAQANAGYTTVIGGESAPDALHNVQYAKAWGMQRKAGKVTVTRLPEKAGKGDPLNLRVTLAKYDPNAQKRGRKPGSNGQTSES
jgi:hypothetical protein